MTQKLGIAHNLIVHFPVRNQQGGFNWDRQLTTTR